MKYAWIDKHRDSFPVAVMCAVLGASTSGYYAAVARGEDSRLYPWGNQPNPDAIPKPGRVYGNAWTCDEVDDYPANTTPEGVIGMVGLEGEYCSDHYADEHLATETIDPDGPSLEQLPLKPSNPLLASTPAGYHVLKGSDFVPTEPLASIRSPADVASYAGFYGMRVVVIPKLLEKPRSEK